MCGSGGGRPRPRPADRVHLTRHDHVSSRGTRLNETFNQHIQSLPRSLKALLACEPFTFASLPARLPGKGIYLFSEGDALLYVGRTNRMRQRLQQHCRLKISHRSAPFAFRLARHALGLTRATYRQEGSRAHLAQDATFQEAFAEAVARMRRMHIRVAEEEDQTRQALLEIYAAVSLATPYNEFRNH